MSSDHEVIMRHLGRFGVKPDDADDLATLVIECLRLRWSSTAAVDRARAADPNEWDYGHLNSKDMEAALLAAMASP